MSATLKELADQITELLPFVTARIPHNNLAHIAAEMRSIEAQQSVNYADDLSDARFVVESLLEECRSGGRGTFRREERIAGAEQWLLASCDERDNPRAESAEKVPAVNVQMLDALRKHHKWHCDIGEVIFPSDPEITIDLTDGYSDSTLCEETIAAIRAAEAAPVNAGGSNFCLKCHAEFGSNHLLCCDEGTDANGSINGVCAKCCDGRLHGKDEAAPVPESADAGLLKLAKEIETHCPCGARPESPRTHPHVLHCPVAKLVRALESRSGAAQKAEKS